jgi:hypothetical protein
MREKSAVQRVEGVQNDWHRESDPLNVALVLAAALRNDL